MAVRSTPKDDDESPGRRRRGNARAATGSSTSVTDLQQAAQTSDEPESEEGSIAADLSYRDAQTALELSLAELQAPELDVEEMAGLYRRASRYAERCEQLLQQVEQQVMQWNPGQPTDPPQPYQS